MNTLFAILRGLAIFAILSMLITACDSTEPENDAGEEEVISNVTITLENTTNDTTITAEAVFDEAGVKQSAETLTLTAGTTYNGSIELRNRFADEDITEEVEAEAEEHRFFYEVLGSVGNAVTVTITDSERDYGSQSGINLPVGLRFAVTVVPYMTGTGELRVVLGHYAERPKQTDETIANIPEKDVDFTYPVTVQ